MNKGGRRIQPAKGAKTADTDEPGENDPQLPIVDLPIFPHLDVRLKRRILGKSSLGVLGINGTMSRIWRRVISIIIDNRV